MPGIEGCLRDNRCVLAGTARSHDGVHDRVALAYVGDCRRGADVVLVGTECAHVVFYVKSNLCQRWE